MLLEWETGRNVILKSTYIHSWPFTGRGYSWGLLGIMKGGKIVSILLKRDWGSDVETWPTPSLFIWAELRFIPQMHIWRALSNTLYCLWQGECEMSKDEGFFKSPLKKPVIEWGLGVMSLINKWLAVTQAQNVTSASPELQDKHKCGSEDFSAHSGWYNFKFWHRTRI